MKTIYRYNKKNHEVIEEDSIHAIEIRTISVVGSVEWEDKQELVFGTDFGINHFIEEGIPKIVPLIKQEKGHTHNWITMCSKCGRIKPNNF